MKHNLPSPAAPKRVVILGATGFVAGDLARELSEARIPHKLIGSREIDLTIPEAPAKLAAELQPGDSLVMTSALTPDKGKDVGTFMKNLAMANSVCEAIANGVCSQVIYISSDAVYEDGASLIRESSPVTSGSLYGIMHHAREKMLAFALAKHKTPVCVVRPSAVYGPGDTHNAYGPNRFLRAALSERRIKLFGQGEEQRDHIYIGDLSRLLRLCLEYRTEGVVNAVTGQAISFCDLAQKIGAKIGHSVQVEGSPRANPITHRHYDVSERLKAFPEFKTVPIDEGLAQTLTALRAEQPDGQGEAGGPLR